MIIYGKRGNKLGAVVISFFASRVPFLGINPVAVSLYVLAYSRDRTKNKCIAAVIAGVISCILLPAGSMELPDVTKYMLIFACIAAVDRIAVRRGIYMKRLPLRVMAGCITSFIGLAGGMLDISGMLVVSVGEGILVIILAQLFEKGLYLIMAPKKVDTLSNEQLISLVMLFVAAVGGIYEPFPEIFSLSGGLLYLFIIFMAQKYGAAAGAVTGAGAGVLSGIRGGDISFIGLFCLAGITAGIMRKAGKWMSLAMFVMSGLLLAMLYPSELWNAVTLRGFISAAVVYAFIPSSYMRSGEDEDNESEDDVLAKYSIRTQASYKLRQFADAFFKLSDSLSGGYELAPAADIGAGSVNCDVVFNQITEAVCKDCTNCSICWQNRYYDTYHEAIEIIGAGNGGKIAASDIPAAFALKCIQVDNFMGEVNKQIEIARINVMWQSRINQNRMLMAGQMQETARLINELDNDISGISRMSSVEGEEEILAMLRAFGLKVNKLVMAKRRDGQQEVVVQMRAARNNCVTYREVADMIGGVLGDRWCVADGFTNTVPKEYQTVSFVKDSKYRILTGVARTAKAGEDVSGDNYSFIRLSGGRVIMTITDGMGSGMPAYEESEKVIELIEQFVQAGFREDMALRIVNSSLLLDGEKDDFSTVDICVIDLNNATCECMKYGAPATFIRKRDSVKVVNSETMPIGILPDISTYDSTHILGNGDFVIMLSDGVTDSFTNEPYGVISDIIKNIHTDNPQELADRILSEALNCNMRRARDDMSVLVAGIWEKS